MEPLTTPDLKCPEPDVIARAGDLLGTGRPAEAYQLIRESAREAPPNVPARQLLAQCLAALGRHDESLAVYLELRGMRLNDSLIGQRIHALEQSLAPPEAVTGQRPWTTSIPDGFLNTIQHALHRYTYAGIPMLKNPFDLAIYASLLHDLRPKLIVEIGSKSGSSALWLAHQTMALGFDCRVLSVDVVGVKDVRHERVFFLEGDGRRLDLLINSEALGRFPKPWLVIDDADHAYATCAAVAEFFDPLLRSGDFLVIEDGIASDLAPDAFPDAISGPHRAIRGLISSPDPKYEIATEYCDMFGTNVTWCTNGYLRRIQ